MYPRSIYVITHKPTGRSYVGSSRDVEKRIKQHLAALKNGKHPVEDMQNDYDVFGNSYTFSVIGQINDKSEDHKEYDCMLMYDSNIRAFGYNYKDKKCPRPTFTVSPAQQLLQIVRSSENPKQAMMVAKLLITTMLQSENICELTGMRAAFAQQRVKEV